MKKAENGRASGIEASGENSAYGEKRLKGLSERRSLRQRNNGIGENAALWQ